MGKFFKNSVSLRDQLQQDVSITEVVMRLFAVLGCSFLISACSVGPEISIQEIPASSRSTIQTAMALNDYPAFILVESRISPQSNSHTSCSYSVDLFPLLRSHIPPQIVRIARLPVPTTLLNRDWFREETDGRHGQDKSAASKTSDRTPDSIVEGTVCLANFITPSFGYGGISQAG